MQREGGYGDGGTDVKGWESVVEGVGYCLRGMEQGVKNTGSEVYDWEP